MAEIFIFVMSLYYIWEDLYMDFCDKLKDFATRIDTIKESLKTEEAVKTSLVLPFFQILGYDVFNPYEFVPEFNADTGIKKGEKVDYAIILNNEPTILVEAKSLDKDLNKHTNQLYRYFSVTKAKFAVLTNGIIYKFYTDLEEPNIMDEVPFLEINLLQLKDASISQIRKFAKDSFNIQDILDSASDLKYTAMIKSVLAEQLRNPSDQFIKFILGKGIYSGTKTQAVIDRFKGIIQTSFNQYIADLVNEKIQTALDGSMPLPEQMPSTLPKKELTITETELQILDSIKEMISPSITSDSIMYKKTERYVALQLGNNIRKWVCRIYIKQNPPHTFQLHKLGEEDYECEYFFEESYQLEQIKELIISVSQKCTKL